VLGPARDGNPLASGTASAKDASSGTIILQRSTPIPAQPRPRPDVSAGSRRDPRRDLAKAAAFAGRPW